MLAFYNFESNHLYQAFQYLTIAMEIRQRYTSLQKHEKSLTYIALSYGVNQHT